MEIDKRVLQKLMDQGYEEVGDGEYEHPKTTSFLTFYENGEYEFMPGDPTQLVVTFQNPEEMLKELEGQVENRGLKIDDIANGIE